MPRKDETNCAPGYSSWVSPLARVAVGQCTEIVRQPPQWSAGAGLRGCRDRWHRGRLSCDVGAAPACGEAGQLTAPLHGGLGV